MGFPECLAGSASRARNSPCDLRPFPAGSRFRRRSGGVSRCGQGFAPIALGVAKAAIQVELFDRRPRGRFRKTDDRGENTRRGCRFLPRSVRRRLRLDEQGRHAGRICFCPGGPRPWNWAAPSTSAQCSFPTAAKTTSSPGQTTPLWSCGTTNRRKRFCTWAKT